MVEILINGRLADSIRQDLAARSDSFIVPHLLDIAVASALRTLVAGQRVDSHRMEQAGWVGHASGLALLAHAFTR